MAVFFQNGEDIGRELENEEFPIPSPDGHVNFIVNTNDAASFRRFRRPDFGKCFLVVQYAFNQDFDFPPDAFEPKNRAFNTLVLLKTSRSPSDSLSISS